MSGPWEKYVEQAAKAASDSRAPVWRWDCLTDSERESRIGQMRAALAAVGPLIQEDTRDRMVAAAGAALERAGALDLKPLVCPYCGGELDVETDPVPGYYSETIIDRIECQTYTCGGTWQRDGVALMKPRKLCGTCETSQRTADDMGGKVPPHSKAWGGHCSGDPV